MDGWPHGPNKILEKVSNVWSEFLGAARKFAKIFHGLDCVSRSLMNLIKNNMPFENRIVMFAKQTCVLQKKDKHFYSLSPTYYLLSKIKVGNPRDFSFVRNSFYSGRPSFLKLYSCLCKRCSKICFILYYRQPSLCRARYNDKIRYNDNLTVTKPSLKR